MERSDSSIPPTTIPYNSSSLIASLLAPLFALLTAGTASAALNQFARDPNFYPGYARNFIGKSVKSNAEDDPRVGKIRLASTTLVSIKDILDKGTGSKIEVEDAVARCKKAQNLIGDFLAESGVNDDRVVAFAKAHHT